MEVAQVVAADLTESEQRIDELSVQYEVLQLGGALVGTGIRGEDRSNDGFRAINDIGARCHAHLADQSIETHHGGSLCLVADKGVEIQLRRLVDELRVESLPPNLVLRGSLNASLMLLREPG